MAGSIYIDFQKQPWFTAIEETRTLPYIYNQCKESILTDKMVYLVNLPSAIATSALPIAVTRAANTIDYIMTSLVFGYEFTVTSDNVMTRTR